MPSTVSTPEVSIVVPIYNEVDNLPDLVARMHVTRRYENGRLEFWKSTNMRGNYQARASVREATQAAGAWAASQR